MNESTAHLFHLNDECIQTCRELIDCLNAEHAALIQLKTEEISRINLSKENLLYKIAEKKGLIRSFTLSAYGVTILDEIEAKLPEEDRAEWSMRRKEWADTWRRLHDVTLRNQSFLRHSLKNLGRLVDNFKRLIGEVPLYSSKGTQVDSMRPGKVVEASY